MHVERVAATGTFRIVAGADSLPLTKTQYEDLHFALPLDPATLFRLINDTLLQGVPERQKLKAMIDASGGMHPALNALSASAQALVP